MHSLRILTPLALGLALSSSPVWADRINCVPKDGFNHGFTYSSHIFASLAFDTDTKEARYKYLVSSDPYPRDGVAPVVTWRNVETHELKGILLFSEKGPSPGSSPFSTWISERTHFSLENDQKDITIHVVLTDDYPAAGVHDPYNRTVSYTEIATVKGNLIPQRTRTSETVTCTLYPSF